MAAAGTVFRAIRGGREESMRERMRERMPLREREPEHEYEEGRLTRMIEHQTSRAPSSAWLVAAGGSIAAAMALKIAGRTDDANFVGQWAPTFLMIGVYNKLVKVLGSE